MSWNCCVGISVSRYIAGLCPNTSYVCFVKYVAYCVYIQSGIYGGGLEVFASLMSDHRSRCVILLEKNHHQQEKLQIVYNKICVCYTCHNRKAVLVDSNRADHPVTTSLKITWLIEFIVWCCHFHIKPSTQKS